MRALVILAVVSLAAGQGNFFKLPQPYSYNCLNNNCVREERSTSKVHQPLERCQLTCGQFGSLWPQPTGETVISDKVVHFDPYNMQVSKIATSNERVAEMLDDAVRYFRRTVHFNHPDFPENQKTPYTYEVKAPANFDDFSREGEQQQFRQRFDSFNNQRQRFQQQQQQQQQSRFRNAVPQNFQEQNSVNEMSTEEWERYTPFRNQRYNSNIERRNVNLEITVTSPEEQYDLQTTDESYNIVVQTIDDETTVTILATTYYGARHALESLSQLIAYDNENGALMLVSDAKIQDRPQYKYRGLTLDTGRNFYTKEEIMRLLDTMSQNKMNAFHWHITDGASFPMYSNRQPQMAYYGSYSPRKVYYPEDISDIVRYARHRGIMVIPELDAPAHTAAGWEWGEKEGRDKLVLCTSNDKTQTPWYEVGKEPPSGQLNVVNPAVYEVLGEVYRDMVDYFDPQLFHMGGDDVSFKCFDSSPEITNYLASKNIEAKSPAYFDLWNTFQNQAFSKLKEARGEGRTITPIIHSSTLARKFLNKDDYVVQLDSGVNESEASDYVNNGYKVILSNPDQWRLDCLSNRWYGDKAQQCPQDASTWHNFYETSPLQMLYNLGVNEARLDLPANRPTYSQQSQAGQQTSQNLKNFVLGGTATMLSAESDGKVIESKVWPRVSALAERLWSDPLLGANYQNEVPEKRLNIHRERMVNRGVRAEPLQPEFCMHDQTACYNREQYEIRTATPTQ